MPTFTQNNLKKNFLAGIGLALLLNAVIKPLWILGIDRSVQNAVGESEFGFYYVLLNFSLIFGIILDFGVTNFNQKTISQNTHLIKKYTSNILTFKVLLSVIYALLIFITATILHYNGRQMYFLVFLGINQIIASFVLYFRSNITGLLMFKADSIISVLDKALMIVFCGFLLWATSHHVINQSFKIEWLVYSQTLAYIVTLIVAAAVLFKKTHLIKFIWNRPFLILLIRQTFPYTLLALLMSFYYRIDSILISEILPEGIGEQQAGIYAKAYRILDVFGMASYMFSFFILPIFARYIKLKENIAEVVRLSFSILFTGSVVIAIVCSFYSFDLMNLMYKENAAAAANVFRIVICGFVPISTSYVFGTLLTANGNVKYLNFIALIGIVTSLTINFLLIPRFYAVGSAFASLSALTVSAILQILITRYVFKIKAKPNFIFRIFLFIGGTILFCYLSKLSNLNTFINFSIAAVSSYSLAFLLKIITPKYLFNILKEDKNT